MEGKMENSRFKPHKCVVCNGFGTLKFGQKTCQACNGLGYVVIDDETGLPVDRKKEGRKGDEN